MASFCGSCGFPQAAGVAFCPNCGTRQQSGAPAPQQPVVSTPAAIAAPAKMSSGVKVLLVLVGFIVLSGLVAFAGLLYVGHRVKVAVTDRAKAYGIEMPTPSSASSARVKLPKPCDLLSKQEAATLLGEPIERSEMSSEGCMYYGPAGLSENLAKENASTTFKNAEAPGSKVGGAEVATAVDQLVNSMAAAQGSTGSGGEMPLLMLMVDPDGKSQMMALNASKAIFGGIVDSSGAKGMSMGADIPGLGDRAVRMPKLGLNVLKGEILVRIIAGPVPDADAKTISIARTVLAKF